MNQNNDFGNMQYNNRNNQPNQFGRMNQDYNQNNSGYYSQQVNNQFYNNPPVQNQNMYYSYYNNPPKKEKKRRFTKIVLPILIVAFFCVIGGILSFKAIKVLSTKTRTFMIYMVGSDLESASKQGTYSISEIVGENIDLKNNNVLLMVGGSKKWHNFVNAEEIGIYRLTSEGFKKVKTLPVENMGSSSSLSWFLNYSYNNFYAKKFDLIFWNHGLGAMGIEQDELSSDYLSLYELNEALKDSNFKEKKLELTIFYNCLSSNLHIAKIMSNYSDYMVASEEIFYLSKSLKRLNFLEKVKPESTAYEIGKYFIDQSDQVIKNYNESHAKQLDSTLSIIDLQKISELDKTLNEYISTIDLNKNYSKISTLRKNLFTYGTVQTKDYDVVDLYELVVALQPLSNNSNKYKEVVNNLSQAISYTSNLNDHSNGLSIYFPYFGSDTSVGIHLTSFNKLWNDNYTKFINAFYEKRSGAKRAIRNETNSEVNYLENKVVKENNSLVIYLNSEEIEKYQSANIYLFKKEDDGFVLLTKSNDIELADNKLIFDNSNRLLKVDNKLITYIDDDKQYIYGSLNDNSESIDIINYLETIESRTTINQTILDSGIYPSSSLIDIYDYNDMSIYNLKYNLLDENLLIEDWKDTVEKESIEFDINNSEILLIDNNESNYYVMVELLDIYSDSYYSVLSEIK